MSVILIVSCFPIIFNVDRAHLALTGAGLSAMLFVACAMNWFLFRGAFRVPFVHAVLHGIGFLMPIPPQGKLVPGEGRAAILSLGWIVFALATTQWI